MASGAAWVPLDAPLHEVLTCAKPAWKTSDVQAAETKLAKVGITDTVRLATALHAKKLNHRLSKAGLKAFSPETLQALRSVLVHEPPHQEASDGHPQARLDTADVSTGLEQEQDPRNDCDGPGVTVEAYHEVSVKAPVVEDDMADDSPEGPQVRLSKQRLASLLAVIAGSGSQDLSAGRVPPGLLHSGQSVATLRERFEHVETMTVSKLGDLYFQLGFVAPDDGIGRAELMVLVREVFVLQELSMPYLQLQCEERGFLTLDSQPRAELLQLLGDATWEAHGVPVRRLPSLEAARFVLNRTIALGERGPDYFQAQCETWGFPADNASAGNVVPKLKQVYIWQELELPELHRECQARGIPKDRNTERGEMLERLLLSLRSEDAWQARGITAERLGSDLARTVAGQFERVQAMGASALQAEARRVDFRLGADIALLDASTLACRLQDRILFEHLPIDELRSECTARGLPLPDSARPSASLARFSKSRMPWAQRHEERPEREQLLERLGQNAEHDCLVEWEAQGHPVLQARSFASAVILVEQSRRAEEMTPEELRRWYRDTGFIEVDGLDTSDMVDIFRRVRAWEASSSSDLRAQCAERGIRRGRAAAEHGDNEGARPDDEGERLQLIESLLADERLGMWDAKGFQARRLREPDVIKRVVAEYNNLLRVSDAELRMLFAGAGLPEDVSLDRSDLLGALKKMLIWESLPMAELCRDCAERNLPVSPPRRCTIPDEEEEDGRRSELVEQLMSYMCVDMCMSFYEAKGIPVGRLGAWCAGNVAKKLDSFQIMTVKMLKDEHDKLVIPYRPTASRQELLARLQDTIILRALPLSDLRAEWLKTGAPVAELQLDANEEQAKAHLLELLLAKTFRSTFQELGVPVEQLDTFKECTRVAREYVRLEMASPSELEAMWREYVDYLDVKKEDLRPRLKRIALWTQAPFVRLEPVCREHGVDPHYNRKSVVEKLIRAVYPEPPKREAPPPAAAAPPPRDRFRPRPREKTSPQLVNAHFRTLGLAPDAGLHDAKKAYRRLALKYHPDKNRGIDELAAAENFRKVTEAYRALCEALGAHRLEGRGTDGMGEAEDFSRRPQEYARSRGATPAERAKHDRDEFMRVYQQELEKRAKEGNAPVRVGGGPYA